MAVQLLKINTVESPIIDYSKCQAWVVAYGRTILDPAKLSITYLSSGRLWEVKNKGKFQTILGLKVVAVAHERCMTLTSGFKYSDLT